MDVFSIVSASAAALNAAAKLALQFQQFIEATARIDRTIGEMARETRAIEMSLRSIERMLKSRSFLAAEARLETSPENLREAMELREALLGSLSDCQSTLVAVEEVISPLLPSKSNWVGQATRQAKLNLKQAEINALYQQLRGNRGAMQLTLQMITLRATCLAPGLVIDELGPKIDELRKLMDKSELRSEELRALGVNQDEDNSVKLRLSAERVLSSATTVSGGSEATGSVMGDGPLNDGKRKSLQTWIEENDFAQIPMEEDVKDSVTESSQATSFHDRFQFSETKTAPTALTDPASTAEADFSDEESDSDEALQCELVDALVKKADNLFQKKDYVQAHRHFKDGLMQAKELPIGLRNRSNLENARLKLASCYAHLANLNEAESSLHAIVDDHHRKSIRGDNGNNDQQANRLCEASYLLAVVLFCKGNYEDARSHCRKSIMGRRRTLGKTHVTVYQSYWLMSQIYEAEENGSVALVYLGWIPEDIQPLLVKVSDEFPAAATFENHLPGPHSSDSEIYNEHLRSQEPTGAPDASNPPSPFTIESPTHVSRGESAASSTSHDPQFHYNHRHDEALPKTREDDYQHLSRPLSMQSEVRSTSRPMSVSTSMSDQNDQVPVSPAVRSRSVTSGSNDEGLGKRRSLVKSFFRRKPSSSSPEMEKMREEQIEPIGVTEPSEASLRPTASQGLDRKKELLTKSAPTVPIKALSQAQDPSFVEFARQRLEEERAESVRSVSQTTVSWQGLF